MKLNIRTVRLCPGCLNVLCVCACVKCLCVFVKSFGVSSVPKVCVSLAFLLVFVCCCVIPTIYVTIYCLIFFFFRFFFVISLGKNACAVVVVYVFFKLNRNK